MQFDQASVNKRFHEAMTERAGAMERLRPIWEAHKDIIEQIKALEDQAAPLSEQMRPIRDKLVALENEISACARFFRDEEGKSRMGDALDYLTQAELDAAYQKGLNG
jgi:hypothetical protein